ncbi:DUF4810 domain-containing protein [Rheinheimera sp. EpRS3]|uniref:DUF4810 domain-containing protein n=1 Tax=Rheinheimera sp. EpRS3 TaxID=1712383 RepID=UPI000749E639|nr:DUF4810 domain-containing protein [Rheinheimera sp. EpRS3]KUM51979.1 hypothetical protein AR688_01295 [Rheinheimera sp. EpRS3]
MKKIVCVLSVLLSLSACKTTESLYYHGEYNKAVYTYFKADETTPADQIATLQQIIQAAEAAGKPVAPGIHAHLGLLYFDTGNVPQGQQHFEYEKALFPESTQYLDFLLKSRQGA